MSDEGRRRFGADVWYAYPSTTQQPDGKPKREKASVPMTFTTQATAEEFLAGAAHVIATKKGYDMRSIVQDMMLCCFYDSTIYPLDMTRRVLDSPEVQKSLAERQRATLTIESKERFAKHLARTRSKLSQERAQSGSPKSSPQTGGRKSSPRTSPTQQPAAPPPAAAKVTPVFIAPQNNEQFDPLVVADELVSRELKRMEESRASLGLKHWTQFVKKPVPSLPEWAAMLKAERLEVEAETASLTESAQQQNGECRSLESERDHVLKDISELEASILRSQPQFDERARLQQKLETLKEEVSRRTVRERDLFEAIEAAHARRREAVRKELERSKTPPQNASSMEKSQSPKMRSTSAADRFSTHHSGSPTNGESYREQQASSVMQLWSSPEGLIDSSSSRPTRNDGDNAAEEESSPIPTSAAEQSAVDTTPHQQRDRSRPEEAYNGINLECLSPSLSTAVREILHKPQFQRTIEEPEEPVGHGTHEEFLPLERAATHDRSGSMNRRPPANIGPLTSSFQMLAGDVQQYIAAGSSHKRSVSNASTAGTSTQLGDEHRGSERRQLLTKVRALRAQLERTDGSSAAAGSLSQRPQGGDAAPQTARRPFSVDNISAVEASGGTTFGHSTGASVVDDDDQFYL